MTFITGHDNELVGSQTHWKAVSENVDGHTYKKSMVPDGNDLPTLGPCVPGSSG